MSRRPVPPERVFPTSKVDAKSAEHVPSAPQTESKAYKLAFQDAEFLLREDLRPVRFQLELLKPELLLAEANIGSTFVFYGSARIPRQSWRTTSSPRPPTTSSAPSPNGSRPSPNITPSRTSWRGSPAASSSTRRGKSISSFAPAAGRQSWKRPTGAPQTKAANRLASTSFFPTSRCRNRFVTPELSFQFHYFALRKMHFLLHARAVAVFPGGAALDEFFRSCP